VVSNIFSIIHGIILPIDFHIFQHVKTTSQILITNNILTPSKAMTHHGKNPMMGRGDVGVVRLPGIVGGGSSQHLHLLLLEVRDVFRNHFTEWGTENWNRMGQALY